MFTAFQANDPSIFVSYMYVHRYVRKYVRLYVCTYVSTMPISPKVVLEPTISLPTAIEFPVLSAAE
jgi:hypothetical protein